MSRIRAIVLGLVVAAAHSGVAGQSPVSSDFVLPATPVPPPAAVASALATLSASSIAAEIAFLASPGMGGRGLGQPGLDATTDHVASTLAIAGVRPLRTPVDPKRPLWAYFQPVPVRELTNRAGSVTVRSQAGGVTSTRVFLSGIDCVFQEMLPGSLAGTVVFAGYGIRESNPARDDYRGLDVKDRIVLAFAGVPSGPEWQAGGLIDKYAAEGGRSRYAAKAELAASLGARALVLVEDDRFSDVVLAGTDDPTPRYFGPYAGIRGDLSRLPVVRVSTAVGAAVLATGGIDVTAMRQATPRVVEGASVDLSVTGTERLVVARNVVAVVPGSDPVLKDQAIVIGAHMDHLGLSGHTFFPGADDNASGTAALLEMARAFAASPTKPKRTIVIAFWTGEEEGHLGSEYYGTHPLWPLDRTAAYLNLDMIAHPWSKAEIEQLVADTKFPQGRALLSSVEPEDFVELGIADSAPDLAPVLERAARATGVALHLDRTDGKSGGSDYRVFARHGRPFVRFFGNFHPDYHETSDTPDKVDAGQVLKMARLAFVSAWLLADR